MRLLSLVCLARCAALPDIGVTYAATGRLNVLMAAESVRRLSTRYAHVHTLSADDHATCERLRGGAPWKCVDVTSGTSHAAQLWRHLAKYTAVDAPCRNSHSIAPTRLLKMVAIAAAPFRHNIFLDADTVPCFDLATLYTQLRAGGGMGLLDVYDLLLVPARESVPSGPAAAKGTWRAPAYDKSNSGVILWRKSRATMKLYHSWIHAYCSEKKLGTRGSAESNGADQNVLSYEILHAVKRDGLLVYSLGPWWNYRSWRRHFANKPGCCSSASRVVEAVSGDLQPPPVYIDHACRKPRDYVKRTGNASYFLGDGDDAGRRRV